MEKMSIKEAGRYANFLENIISSLIKLIYGELDSKLIEVTEVHKKSEAYKEAENEILNIEFENEIDVEVDILADIIEKVVEEKISLANAINKAKKDIAIKIKDKEMDLDSSIEYAKLLRRVCDGFYKILTNKKESKKKTVQKAYAFNVEGNQTPYFYEVEIETVLKFDKEIFIRKDRKNRILADLISKEIDKAMNSDIVDFNPSYNYLDGIEDVIKKYTEIWYTGV